MLLNVSGLEKSFAASEVLRGVDLRVERKEKIALVGRNGSGKTTLLKVLTGELTPDSGSVSWERGVTVGYLSQHSALDETLTVLEEAERARRHLLDIRKRLAALEQKLAGAAAPEDLDEYTLLHEHFTAEGGYSAEQDVLTVLGRMGFRDDELAKPVSALSGGERTRLTIARLLLEEPEILILDEPTNHLDLEATEWLESWLRGYGGAVLAVSHDRTFLQNVAERVVEIRDGRTKSYLGSFEKFMELRRAEEARLGDVSKQQQAQIDKLDEYVRRFMNSERTSQARGRLKQMEKLISAKVETPKHDRAMQAGFAKTRRSGDLVVVTKGLSLRFGSQGLFENLDWTVRWGERWGVVGQNGSGKSTLIKVLLGKLEATEGTHRLGANVFPGYFAQDAEELDLSRTPLEVMNRECGLNESAARAFLGRFLISGEDALRPLKTLSGGERNKLSLAKLTVENPNLLILDEPTNHLDIASREALASVLKEFKGTLILVSHDRWLLQQVTDHTLEVRFGACRQFGGSYDAYRRFHRIPESKPNAEIPKPTAAEPSGIRRTPREISKEITRLQKAVSEAERIISELERELRATEHDLAEPPGGSDLVALSISHQALQGLVSEATDEWMRVSTELQEMREAQKGGRTL